MNKPLSHLLYLNGYGETGTRISAVTAAVGTVFTLLLGGWDLSMKLLMAAMLMDFVTGILKAIYQAQKGIGRGLDSEVMFWGGMRKGLVMVVVALGVGLDLLLNTPSPLCRTAVIYYYIGREGLSLTENLGLLGVPLPSFLTKILAQLQEQGDAGEAVLSPTKEEKSHV